jgi:hypothetical protein
LALLQCGLLLLVWQVLLRVLLCLLLMLLVRNPAAELLVGPVGGLLPLAPALTQHPSRCLQAQRKLQQQRQQ